MRHRARRLGAASVIAAGLCLATTAAAEPAAHASSLAQAASLKSPAAPVPAGPTRAGPAVGSRSAGSTVLVASRLAAHPAPALGPVRRLMQADVFVVAPTGLPGTVAARIARLPGVAAAERVDAARIQVNGAYVAMLGVDPSAFRAFAAPPTARARGLWQNVAGGGIAVSYTMGRLGKMALGQSVQVAGAHTEKLRVGGFGTVGIAGVDAVVSDTVARSLGIPADNAIVISAPHADLSTLASRIRKLLPRRAAVATLVAQQGRSGAAAAPGAAGASGLSGVTSNGQGLSRAEIIGFLTAAESRIGMPYVWGAAGPRAFDCSGLVQWSLAQAGVTMPRVAAAQALTGPRVPVTALQPGDLLFYHTDPTAPSYISHVAIYIGNGKMLQAPEPGMNVEVVAADVGAGFAGAVRIYPRVAAAVAGNPAA